MIYIEKAVNKRSPHTWGLTDGAAYFGLAGEAFPTHVGINRLSLDFVQVAQSVPHTRGD